MKEVKGKASIISLIKNNQQSKNKVHTKNASKNNIRKVKSKTSATSFIKNVQKNKNEVFAEDAKKNHSNILSKFFSFTQQLMLAHFLNASFFQNFKDLLLNYQLNNCFNLIVQD